MKAQVKRNIDHLKAAVLSMVVQTQHYKKMNCICIEPRSFHCHYLRRVDDGYSSLTCEVLYRIEYAEKPGQRMD